MNSLAAIDYTNRDNHVAKNHTIGNYPHINRSAQHQLSKNVYYNLMEWMS